MILDSFLERRLIFHKNTNCFYLASIFVSNYKEFNHRSHLRLAYIYLAEHDDDTAYQLMRESLIRFITHNGVDRSKFHETITRAWILAVMHFMENDTGAESANAFIENNPKMLDKEIMMTHYSAELLFSDKAREKFVAPDLEPIPRHEN